MEMLSTPTIAMAEMPSTSGLNAFKDLGVSQRHLEETAHDFESVFMAQMIKPMWEGLETDGEFGGGPGEDVMRQMMIQEYGKSMAQSSGYPMSKDIMAEMIRLQEQANGTRS